MLPPRRFCPLKWPQEAARIEQDGKGRGVLLSGQESYERSLTRGLAGDGATGRERDEEDVGGMSHTT